MLAVVALVFFSYLSGKVLADETTKTCSNKRTERALWQNDQTAYHGRATSFSGLFHDGSKSRRHTH